MKVFISILSILFLVACSNTDVDNSTATQLKEPFSIKMGASRTPIAVNSKLLLTASTALDPTTVTKENIYLQDVYGSRHPIDVGLTGQQILVKPLIYLAGDTTYEIIITTNVIAADGKKRNRAAIISFTSSSSVDTAAPTLTTTLPLNNSTNMEPYGIFYFQFSEPLSPLFDLNATRLYDQNDTNYSGITTLSGSLISFKPDINLTNDTNYTFTLALDTSSITDLSSNTYNSAAVEEINFTITSTPTPILNLAEMTQGYDINTVVNCITAFDTYDPILYIGGEAGFHIIAFDYNTSENNASTFQLLSSLPASEVGTVYDIDFDQNGTRAYLASSIGIFIVDINNTSNIQVINQYETVDQKGSIPVYGIDAESSHIYAAATSMGVLDINISDENNLSMNILIDTNGTAFDVTDNNNTLYISDYDQNIVMYNLLNASTSTISTLGQTRSMFSYTDFSPNDNVMVASGVQGLFHYSTDGNESAYPTASYISHLKRNTESSSQSFAIVKGIGLVFFSEYDSYGGSNSINSYQYIPFNITASGYLWLNDTTIIFVADTNGTVHVY